MAKFDVAKVEKWFSREQYTDAFTYLQKFAAPECPDAMAMLGFCYLKGYGTDVSTQKAAECILQSVSNGSDYGKALYAVLQFFGYGVDKDEMKAISELEKQKLSCHSFDKYIIRKLSDRYLTLHRDDYDHDNEIYANLVDFGKPLFQGKTLKHFESKSPKMTNEEYYFYESCYGVIVPSNCSYYWEQEIAYQKAKWAKSPEKPFDVYLRAAKAGHAASQLRVAHFYETGDGIARDLDEAIKWTKRAGRDSSFDCSAEIIRLSDLKRKLKKEKPEIGKGEVQIEITPFREERKTESIPVETAADRVGKISIIKRFGLPEYKEDSLYALLEIDKIGIMNVTNEDVRAYVKILKQAGFTYVPLNGYNTEEEALNMNLWDGKKGNMTVKLMLMREDLWSGRNNLEIKKSDP